MNVWRKPARVKDLPKKQSKVSAKDLKKVRGGVDAKGAHIKKAVIHTI